MTPKFVYFISNLSSFSDFVYGRLTIKTQPLGRVFCFFLLDLKKVAAKAYETLCFNYKLMTDRAKQNQYLKIRTLKYVKYFVTEGIIMNVEKNNICVSTYEV